MSRKKYSLEGTEKTGQRGRTGVEPVTLRQRKKPI